MDGANRRASPRVAFLHTGEALVQQRIAIEIVDISDGGVALKTSQALSLGSLVNLVLFKGNLAIEAEIVSCAPLPRRRNRFRAGARFTTHSRDLLEEVLAIGRRMANDAFALVHRRRGKHSARAVEVRLPPQVTPAHLHELEAVVDQELDEGIRRLAIDLAAVSAWDESLPPMLARVAQLVREEQGCLVLAGGAPALLAAVQAYPDAAGIARLPSMAHALHALESGAAGAR
ncbi:MAG: PilZ domain-containing protein [Candidatus Lambdaproteobacteria bacterium]|nr:PilZ domain-containing protein [Candidatus Lambdaproteobacteria bacterium]